MKIRRLIIVFWERQNDLTTVLRKWNRTRPWLPTLNLCADFLLQFHETQHI